MTGKEANAMLEMKHLFPPERITIIGADDTGKVADYLGLNAAQEQKLQMLFSD